MKDSAQDQKHASAFDWAVGTRIRARRLELGLTQWRVADSLRITLDQFRRYEDGAVRTPTSSLLRIAGIFGVPVQALLPDECDETQGPTAHDLPTLFERIRERRSRHLVLTLVRELVEAEEGYARQRVQK